MDSRTKPLLVTIVVATTLLVVVQGVVPLATVGPPTVHVTRAPGSRRASVATGEGAARSSPARESASDGVLSANTSIQDAGHATGLAFDPVNGNLYATNSYWGNLSVFNTTTNRFVPFLGEGTIPQVSGNLAVDTVDGDVYVSNYNCPPASFWVIHNTSIVTTFRAGSCIPSVGTAYDPLNGDLYVLNDSGNTVVVVNTTTNTVSGSITVGTEPSSIAIDTENDEVFIPNVQSHNVSIIDGATNTVVGSIAIPSQQGGFFANGLIPIAFDSVNGNVYVTNIQAFGGGSNYSYNASLVAISGTTHSVVSTIRLSPSNCQSGGCSYVEPVGLTFVSETGLLYIPNGYSNDVLVANASTEQSLGSIDVGQGPTSVAFDPVDGDLFVANGSATIAVVPPVVPVAIVVNPSTYSMVVGSSQRFTASMYCTTGTCAPNGTYHWSLNNTAGTFNSTTGGNVEFTADSVGLVALYVNASLNQYKASQAIAVTIDPILSAALIPAWAGTDVNATLALRVSHAGGTGGPYQYTYSESTASAGCALIDGPELYCTPTTVGAFTASVNLSDAAGHSTLVTSPSIGVSPQLFATLSASNATPLLGQTVAFVVSASGGLGSYSYSYSGLPPGCVSEDKSAIGCLPTQAEYYNITAAVTDGNIVTALSTVEIHVIFDFNVVVPTSTSVGSPFTISVNANETFSGGTALVPEAGFGTFSYNYTGLPPGCTSADAASITCTPSQVGTYNITVSVHDQLGDHNTHTVPVRVIPAQSPSGKPGFSGDTGYLVIGGGVAIATILAGVFVLRRRGRSPPSAPTKKEEQAAPEKRPSTDTGAQPSDTAVEKSSAPLVGANNGSSCSRS